MFIRCFIIVDSFMLLKMFISSCAYFIRSFEVFRITAVFIVAKVKRRAFFIILGS